MLREQIALELLRGCMAISNASVIGTEAALLVNESRNDDTDLESMAWRQAAAKRVTSLWPQPHRGR